MSTALDRLLALQGADGTFESVIANGARESPDRNGFVAALVLRALRRVPAAGAIQGLRRRALDFIARCASREWPGAFTFWPPQGRPAWALDVPADVDDTVVMALELHRHGRLDRAEALRSLAAILPCRVGAAAAAVRPAWIAAGSFHTWMGAGADRQLVDCCVNANVVACMARLGVRGLPGYHEAIRTVLEGLAWAGRDRRRLDSLTPFYPSPHALREAVSHAAECGVGELRAASATLRALLPPAPVETSGCCRGAYGGPTWRCTALDAARTVAAGSPHEEGRLPCPS